MSEAPRRRPWLGLSVTLLTQVLATLTLSSVPVLAPAVAPQLGLAPERVGLFTGLAYAVAMCSGLASGAWVARHGPTRLMQVVLACMALGAMVLVVAHPLVLLLAAAAMGVGYGVANPASADILGRHAPVNAPGLFFALKQTGVPIGVALAGVLMPLGLALVGWQGAALGVAGVGLLVMLAIQPAIAPLDGGRHATAVASVGWRASLTTVVRRPLLRTLGLVTFAFALTQQAFLTFVVALLHLERGLPLAWAAGMLSASQVVCVGMRVAMGHVADRWVSPRVLLGSLGLCMAASCLALGLLPAQAPVPLVAGVVVLAGATTMGWNGVFFAQLVRSVPREELADSAGATQFFIFGGAMLGPLLFGAMVHLGVSHALGYVLLAGLAGTAGWVMLRAPGAEPGARSLENA